MKTWDGWISVDGEKEIEKALSLLKPHPIKRITFQVERVPFNIIDGLDMLPNVCLTAYYNDTSGE